MTYCCVHLRYVGGDEFEMKLPALSSFRREQRNRVRNSTAITAVYYNVKLEPKVTRRKSTCNLNKLPRIERASH